MLACRPVMTSVSFDPGGKFRQVRYSTGRTAHAGELARRHFGNGAANALSMVSDGCRLQKEGNIVLFLRIFTSLLIGNVMEREGMKAWADPLYDNSGWSRIIKSTEFYFRPGLTWAYRTHLLCLQELPSGAIISVRGSGAYPDDSSYFIWLALGNTLVVDFLVKVAMGRGGHPQFDQGDLKQIPIPLCH